MAIENDFPDFCDLFESLDPDGLARIEFKAKYSRASAYFMTLCLNLRHCTGSREIGGPHIEISETLRCQPFFQVQENDYKRFNGLISNICNEQFSGTKTFEPPEIDTCWHVKDSQILCPGTRKDVHDLVVSIPVILGIEVGDETAGRNRHRGAKRQYWNFPETITPDSEEAAIEFEII